MINEREKNSKAVVASWRKGTALVIRLAQSTLRSKL